MFLRVHNPVCQENIPCESETENHDPKESQNQINRYHQCYLKATRQFIKPTTATRNKKGNVKYLQHEFEKWIERERQDGND